MYIYTHTHPLGGFWTYNLDLPIMVGIWGFDREDKELDLGFLGRRKKEKYIVFRGYMNNSH